MTYVATEYEKVAKEKCFMVQYCKNVTHENWYYISLTTVVLNSRDRQGKLWLPQFSHF